MPLITLDFICYDCIDVTERLIDRSEINDQTCLKCFKPVEKLVSAPMGYVKDTETRVKYSENKLKSNKE